MITDTGSSKTLHEMAELIEVANLDHRAALDLMRNHLIIWTDEKMCIVRSNKTIEDWLENTSVSDKGGEIHKVLHPGCKGRCDFLDFVEEIWQELQLKTVYSKSFYDHFLERDVRLTLEKIANGGQESRYVFIFEDIWREIKLRRLVEENAALAAKNEELARENGILARTDPLTRIPNRRRLEEELPRILGSCIRNESWISVIMIDIDFFKIYNDTYGHEEGNKALVMVAKILANRAQRNGHDLVARYGGEEFTIGLGTDFEGAKHVARLIQEDLKSLKIENRRSTVSAYLTLSLGICSCIPKKGTTKEQLIQAADSALYRAKELGRNQVVFAESI